MSRQRIARWASWILVASLMVALATIPEARGQAPQPSAPTKKAPRRIEISVTKKGFEPKSIKVKKGEDVTLVFTRTTDDTCVKQVIVYLENDRTIERPLPLGKPVEIAVRFTKTGELGYACAMGMRGGAIFVE